MIFPTGLAEIGVSSVRFGIAAIVMCGIVVLLAGMQVAGWMTDAEILSARQDLIGAQLLELRNFQDALLDLETGQRGYLLTGDEAYLEPYSDGLRNFRKAVPHLEMLFHDDPTVLSEIEGLAKLGEDKENEVSRTIELRRNGGLAAALAVVQTQEGKRTMDEFRRRTALLVAQLTRERAAATAAEITRYRYIAILTAVVIWLILLLVGIAIVLQSRAIGRLDELQRQREREAMHDALTGLPNRRYLQEWLALALAAAGRAGRGLVLLYFDLDGFKAVNDNLGHEAGDRVLQAIAARLRRTMRASDFVARLGGDEFVAALPEAPPATALSGLIDRLHRDLAKAPIPELSDGAVSASIGVARFPDNGADASELLSAADRAMYEAKTSRRTGRLGTVPAAA